MRVTTTCKERREYGTQNLTVDLRFMGIHFFGAKPVVSASYRLVTDLRKKD